MSGENLIFTEPVADELIRIIKTLSPGTTLLNLQLRLVQMGTLRDYLGVKDLTPILPAVLVAPWEFRSNDSTRTTHPQFAVKEMFRILYVRKYDSDSSEEPQRLVVRDVAKIVQVLAGQIRMPNLSMPGGRAWKSHTLAVQWQPPEDEMRDEFTTLVKCAALIHSVDVYT